MVVGAATHSHDLALELAHEPRLNSRMNTRRRQSARRRKSASEST